MIYSFSIKFLSLPALLSQTAGKDAWISALIGTVIELAILFPILLFVSRGKLNIEKFTIILLPIFLFQVLILTNQTFNLLNDNLFDKVNRNLFSIPLLLLGVFFCMMPSRAIFRSGEVFFVFIIIGVVLSVFPAITSINAKEVLPIGSSGAGSIFLAVAKNLIYFEAFLFLLIFKGEIHVAPHFCKKFMTTAVLVGVFFVFFVFMFTSLFGPLAPTKDIAITTSFIGRLDWLLVTSWLLLILLRFGITFFCAYKCVKNIIPAKSSGIVTAGIAVVLAVAVFVVFTFTGVWYA